jgi:hypothetical protein
VSDRTSLLALAVYLTAALLIAVAACVGVMRYGAVARVSALQEAPTDPVPELAMTGLHAPAEGLGSAGGSNVLDQQRVRLLQSMLAEKTKRLEQQAQRIEQQNQVLVNLEHRFEEAVQASAWLDTAKTRVDPPGGETEPPGEGEQEVRPVANPDGVETEWVLTRALHDTLVSDLESLQEELDRVRQQLTELQAAADRMSADQLRDVLALETAAANILLRIGRDSVPALSDALHHSDPIVRRWAATALGSFGSDAADAAGALAEALSDADPSVRRAVVTALDAIER